jgi:hypothetical protein
MGVAAHLVKGGVEADLFVVPQDLDVLNVDQACVAVEPADDDSHHPGAHTLSAVVAEEAAGVSVSNYQGAEDESAGGAGTEPCVEYSSDPSAVGLDDVHAGECAEPEALGVRLDGLVTPA